MRHLHFDCFSGIAGDMTIGALLDAGASEDALRRGLAGLRVGQPFELKIWRERRHGIAGNRVAVLVDGQDADELAHRRTRGPHPSAGAPHSHEHSHEHGHSHEHRRGIHHEGHEHHDPAHARSHSHHDHAHEHSHDHAHEHRPYREIRAMISESALGEEVKKLALAIFQRIAVAEAKIHEQPVEEIAFHEVGAIDSIVDVVGAAILIRELAPTRITASPLPMGHGFVRCQHGRMPVPAPATLEILKGVPLYDAKLRFELVTPTGAAIVAATAEQYMAFAPLAPERIGYGLGKLQLEDRPNALRIILGES